MIRLSRLCLSKCHSDLIPVFRSVFAPNSCWRKQVTPARRGQHAATQVPKTAVERHAAMIWAPRLKRVFKIDIETCNQCGGAVKVIASVEDPAVIK